MHPSYACLLLAFAGCAPGPPPAPETLPPNIVVLFGDDLGYCDTDLYGCHDIPTPNIHRIAAEGVLFTDGYVTAGTCSPSRAGLLTGRHQQRFGFEFNTGSARITFDEKRGLPASEITIADVLSKAGYATGIVGKWHQGVVEGFLPTERGFQEFFGFLPGARSYFDQQPDGKNAASRRFAPGEASAQEGGGTPVGPLNALYRGTEKHSEPEYLTEAFAREAVDFIERHRAEPFFLYVPFNAPHTPIETTEEYARRFEGAEDERRQAYQAMVSALDDAVGRVLDKLDQEGLAENTLVVFSSDNGCATYTRACVNDPLRLGKLFLFEGGVRVPFALRYPAKVTGGKVERRPVSSLDLFPTFAALAGAEAPADREYDGVDLLPYLTGENDARPHEVLYWRNGPNKAIRKGDWKLVWNGRKDWLFDLSQDVSEARNLADEKPEVVEELKRLYDEWQKELVEPLWPARPGNPYTVDGIEVEIEI